MRVSELAPLCHSVGHKMVHTNNFANESFFKTIEDVAPKLEDIMRSCSWQQKRIDCS